MTDSTSRLTIALDTAKAKANADSLATSLERTTVAGDKASIAAAATAKSYRLAATAAAGYIGALSAGAITNDLKQLQSINSRLEGLTGDLAGQQSYLKSTAQELSAEYTTLANGYAKLLPLYDAGLLSLAQTREITEGLANVQAEAGASSAQLGQSMFGLAQGLSAGTLRAEELNQVTEPLPGLLQALDRAADLTAGGFRKMVNEGKVTSSFFRDTLITALEEYDGAAASRADNIEQTFNRTRNAYLDAVEALETPISAVLVTGAEGAAAGFELIEDHVNELVAAVQVAGAVMAANFGASQVTRMLAFAQAQSGIVTTAKALASTEVANAQAKVASTAASLAAAEASATNAAAKLAAVNATAKFLPAEQQLAFVSTQVAAAQKAAAISTAELAAAQNASTAASAKLVAANTAVTRSATAMAVAQRAGAAALGLVGGPVGAALLAAGGIAYLATKQTEAEKTARELYNTIKNLNDEFERSPDAAREAVGKERELGLAQKARLEEQLAGIQEAIDAYDGEGRALERLENAYAKTQGAIQIINDKLAESKSKIDELNQGLNNEAFTSWADIARSQVQKARSALETEADEVQAALAKFFPNEEKLKSLTELKDRLISVKGALDPDDFDKSLAAIDAQIAKLDQSTDATDRAKKAAESLQDALYAAFPEQSRIDEFTKQYELLEAAWKRGGENADQYALAMTALQKEFDKPAVEEAKKKVDALNAALGRRVSVSYSDYADEVKLLNDALANATDNADLTGKINLALSKIDAEIKSELIVVQAAGNRQVLDAAYQEQLDALNEFHNARNINEEAAQQNVTALAQDYAAKLRKIHEDEFDSVTSFLSKYENLQAQPGIDLQSGYDSARAAAEAISNEEYRTKELERIEKAYQIKATELVRSGEATRAQIENASNADRVAGMINSNMEILSAAQNLANQVTGYFSASADIDYQKATEISARDQTRLQAAESAYAASATEKNRIALESAKKQAAISEAAAKREFENQKRYAIAQAVVAQGLTIAQTFASPTLDPISKFAIAAASALQVATAIKQIKSGTFSGGSSSYTPSASADTGSTSSNTISTAPAAPTERLVVFVGDFRSEEEAMFEVGRQQRRLFEEGYINTTPDGLDFGNVPDRTIRLS